MEENMNIKNPSYFVSGVKAGLPVLFGYIPVGIAFGIMAKNAGLTSLQTILMSLFVYTGAGEMAMTTMLSNGVSILMIIVFTFILGLRHLMLSMVVYDKMEEKKGFKRLLSTFFVTDEAFAVFSDKKNKINKVNFFLGLGVSIWVYWNIGTMIGAIGSDFLPPILTLSFGVALYAMFIAIVSGSLKGNFKLLLLCVITAFLNIGLNYIIDSSWAFLISTIVCAAFGVFFVDFKEDQDE